MIILGLDPGLARTGWGLLDTTKRSPHISSGCFTTEPPDTTGQRLAIIAADLTTLLKQHRVDVAVLEQVYFGANATTAMLTANVHGVLLYLLQQHSIPVSTVTPLQIKKHLTDYGFATKSDIQHAITKRLNLATPPQPDDAADALAAAVTHADSIDDGLRRVYR